MGTLVSSLTKSQVSTLFSISEWVLLVSTIILVIGIIGESRTPWWRLRHDVYTFLVALGCIGEFIGEGGVFIFSRQLQVIADAEVKEAVTKSGEAIERAAKLGKEAEDERSARVELEARVAWRRLTKQQKIDIASRLMRFSGETVSFGYPLGDTEANAFLVDISSTLRLAKWKLGGSTWLCFGWVCPPPPLGLFVGSSKDVRSVHASNALVRELKALGFTCLKSPSITNSSVPRVGVTVGARPEGPQGEAKTIELELKKKQAITK